MSSVDNDNNNNSDDDNDDGDGDGDGDEDSDDEGNDDNNAGGGDGIKLTKIRREGDWAMAVGGHHKIGGHNNQPKIDVARRRDIGDCVRLRRNVWGGLAAANEAMKNLKIKIHRGLR